MQTEFDDPASRHRERMMVGITSNWRHIQDWLSTHECKLNDEALHDCNTELDVRICSLTGQLIKGGAGAEEAG